MSDEEILHTFHKEIGGDGFALYEVTPGNVIAFSRALLSAAQQSSQPVADTSADARDAARYRWLRDSKHLDMWWSIDGPADRCANIDIDIDAAIAAQKEREQP